MKKFLFLLTILSLGFLSNAQITKGYLKYDTTYVEKNNGSSNAELVIENSTRNVQDGVLVNTGNGRTKFKTINAGGLGFGSTELFKLEPNSLTSNIIPYTKAGATSTATFTSVGPYDQIAVGGDATSYIKFTNRQFSMGEVVIKLTVKIDSLGTVPLLGIEEDHVGGDGVYSNFGQGNTKAYINLLTGVITTSGVTMTNSINSLTSGVVAGDIVDIYYSRLTASYYHFKVIKRGLGKETSASYNYNVPHADNAWATPSNQHCYQGIIIAGGKYTILEYKVSSPYARPKVLMIGDSFSSGSRIPRSDGFDGQLNSRWGYKCVLGGASSCMLSGMIACSEDIEKMKPQYVMVFEFLDGVFYGYSDSTNGNFATFDVKFKKLVDIIRSAGARPIFVITGPINIIDPTGSKGVKFYNYLKSAFPSDLLLDMRSYGAITTDASNFHPNGAYYAKMVTEFLKMVKDNNL